MTLVEIMVVVAIIVILLALLLPAVNAVRNRAKADSARTQMQMIAMAIDEYARFWPKVLTDITDINGDGDSDGKPDTDTVHGTKGLPAWDFVDVWFVSTLHQPADFELGNEHPAYRSELPLIFLDRDFDRKVALDDKLAALTAEADIYKANECLTWCLTAKVGTGPYLKKPPAGLLQYIPLNRSDPNTYYPTDPANPNKEQRARLYDPWGSPYFYCWVTADGSWLVNENLAGGAWHDNENAGTRFALMSAGPDRRFYFFDDLGDFMPDGPDATPNTGDEPAGPDGVFGTDDDLYDDDIVFGRGG